MSDGASSTFPYDCVVLIESPDPLESGYYLEGSGVVIGPHTILTASHVMFDISEQLPDQNIVVYLGWNSADPALGSGYIATYYTDHFNDIGALGSEELTKAQSALDYAVIDTSYTFTRWMNITVDYAGGEVHMTGYPVTAGGEQTDQSGTVSADPNYSVLDYGTISPQPGNSGGPVWLDYDGSDDVAGIVSTGGYACQLTASDWKQIENWVGEDGYTLATPTGILSSILPEVTPAILWRNTNGNTELWRSNGSGGFTYDNLGVVNTSWQIQGTGDFTGTGEDGILWRNTNGDVELWNPNGSGAYTYDNLGVVNTSWQIQGTGDFTGTGEDGILWRNMNGDLELWNSNGSGAYTYDNLGVVNTSWQIQGSGDFTGTGEDGILWRNMNGDLELWNSNGSGGFTYNNLGVVNTSWQIQGTGDFTGTGEDSILWRDTNGDLELWNPNGSGGFTYDNLGVVDTSWRIQGTGDFTGTGEDSILWRDTNGDLELWNPNGSGGYTYDNLGVVSSSWNIFKPA